MIGQDLKELRQKKGISQQKLADKIGVSRGTILKVEAGQNSLTWGILVKLLTELLPRYPNGRMDFRTLHKYFEK